MPTVPREQPRHWLTDRPLSFFFLWLLLRYDTYVLELPRLTHISSTYWISLDIPSKFQQVNPFGPGCSGARSLRPHLFTASPHSCQIGYEVGTRQM